MKVERQGKDPEGQDHGKMRIVVCVKQIAHTYARTGMSPEDHYLAPEDRIFMVNPYDESAVGMAVRAKKSAGTGEITLLSLGPLIAEKELRRCLAMGADRLCQINVPGLLDPWAKSICLARAVRDMGVDLVFCGKESVDRRNGQVGAFLAHHLNIPFVSCIKDISLSEDKTRAEVLRSVGRGRRELVECPLPAVFSVDLGIESTPYPSYPEKRRSRTVPISRMRYGEDKIAPKMLRIDTFPPRPRTKRIPVPDSRLGAFHRIRRLLRGRGIDKKGELLKGSPESQVERVLSFLESHGFLQAKDPASNE